MPDPYPGLAVAPRPDDDQELDADNNPDPAAFRKVLSALRTAHASDEQTQQSAYRALGLRVLKGGGNNAVFAWNVSGGEVCIKLYRKADRRRVERERHGLVHVAELCLRNMPRVR